MSRGGGTKKTTGGGGLEEAGGGGGSEEAGGGGSMEETGGERRKKQEEERIAIIAKAVDDAHQWHTEKEKMKQLKAMRREELWGKSRGESRGDVRGKAGGASRMWRCDYCIKKNTACHWPSVGSKARSCSQFREHKVTCVVGGEGNKKRKEQGSPEKVV